MKMIKFVSILSFAFLMSFNNDLYACTTFCLNSDNHMVLCKNLDWDFDFGFIEVNKRGLLKRAFVQNNDKPVEWTSKFGSLTFNHIGKEFPLGGMNEAGLVVEEMNYYWTNYPTPDNRPTLNELQWIQYQLDNYSTVDEVINSDSILRISGDIFKIHYLVCDKKGNVATIEFLDGKMICHTKNTLEVPVLTNHRYDESVGALKNYVGFGGTNEIPQDYESLNNFIRVSSLIQKYSSDIPIVDYSFSVLASVSTTDTQWSIVYDISNSSIYFKTLKNQQVKKIVLKQFNFSCDSPVLCLDVNTDLIGDISDKFELFDSKNNERHVDKIFNSYKELRFVKKDSVYFNKLGNYPETVKCLKNQ
jgi:penicillin V acylase-like amidase (Ntn superfamily)